MKQQRRTKDQLRATSRRCGDSEPYGLDVQYAELIETVFGCERTWNRYDRIDSAIKYGR